MENWLDQIQAYIGEQGALEASLQGFASGFPTFALHGGITLVIMLVGLAIHSWLTPYHELKLVRENNIAAGISLGGAFLSLSIPLAFAMASSLNWADLVLWGVMTVLVQLLALKFVDILLHGMPRRIREGEIAAACVLVSVKLSFGFILAAAVAGVPLARF